MFEALPASFRTPPPRASVITSALLSHVVLIAAAITGTASPVVSAPEPARDTIRLDLALLEEQRGFPPSALQEPRLPAAPSVPRPSSAAPRVELPQLSFGGRIPGTSVPLPLASSPPSFNVPDSSPSLFASSEVDQLPQLLTDPDPEYPDVLRRAGVSGAVEVEYVVGTNGRVELRSIRVLSTDHDRFTAAAVKALGNARFKAARRAGQVVSVRVRQVIRFRSETR